MLRNYGVKITNKLTGKSEESIFVVAHSKKGAIKKAIGMTTVCFAWADELEVKVCGGMS